MKLTLNQRFNSKIKILDNGCHEWVSSKNKFGYGKFFWSKGWKLAHRVSWEQKNGFIPFGKFVLHTCDNSSCVNVEHLYLGSYKDNAQDRESRNRGNHVVGLFHGRTKLLMTQIYEIKDLFDTDRYSFRELGKIYGVNGKTVADIINGKNWAHLAQ